MKMNKALLVVLAVMGVSVSGPMVKWSLACGASPVMIAFGRMLISALLLLIPALRSGQLQQVLRAPKKQLGLACAAGFLLALHYTAWMTSLSFASTFVSTALVCTQPLFVAALSGILLHEPIKREAIPGAIVAIIGAALIALLSMSGEHGSLLGDMLALVGAVFIAGHWLCGRAARRDLPAIGYMTFVYIVTAFCLLCFSPFLGGFKVTVSSMGGILVLALACTLGGHALMTYLLCAAGRADRRGDLGAAFVQGAGDHAAAHRRPDGHRRPCDVHLGRDARRKEGRQAQLTLDIPRIF